jgi:hypothetical protein
VNVGLAFRRKGLVTGGGGGATPLAFNPTYTASQNTLSNSNKTVTRNVTGSSNSYATSVANIGHSSDGKKYYFEAHIDSITSGFIVLGVTDLLNSTQVVGISGTDSLGYFNGTPSWLHGGAEDGSGGIPTITNNDVLGFLLDTDAHQLSVRKNSGAFVAASATYLAAAKTWFPAISIRDNALSGITINGGDTPFAFTLPSGATAWSA